uniref:Cytochrome P450 CYP71AR3 n=1 Tax=Valeriana officinalis TaxID=19953 RepID=A0A4Y5R4N5_VALOF|nr:cytochrome P450 CYP71AR3 [Valeriana officinalis]
MLETMFLLIISSIIFVLFNSLLKWFRNPKKNLPPSPSKLPIIGNFHQLGSLPHRPLQKLAQKHGPVFLLHLGQVPVLVVTSPDAAREIMKTHDQIFASRPKTTVASILLYDCKDMVFSPYGEYWRQVKSIGVLNLLSNKRVQPYKTVREEETRVMVEKITEASNNNQVININDLFRSLTNDVVSRVALGCKISEREKGRKFKVLLMELGQSASALCIGDYVPWLWWVDRVNGLIGKVKIIAKEVDDFIQGIVDDHLEKMKKGESKEDNKNFVEILLDIQREYRLGFPISTDTIKALILDMFAAGTDTTSIGLEWMVTELLRHPQVMNKLQNEVRRVVKGKPNVTEEDLEKMSYLKLVIKETLRLHTPVPTLVPRESTHYTKIQGYDIEAGTQVIINAWAIGRDPSVWKDPEEFRPERFLNSRIDFKGLDFEYTPFGAGRRGCPGIQFALAVTELALATLLYRFDIALPPGKRAEDMDMTETPGFNAHPQSTIFVVATPYMG